MPVEHIEFLVEEPSTEAALEVLVPRICGQGITFSIHPYQGKSDLLAKLPARLCGYRSWLPENWGIVALVDEDRQKCEDLKTELEDAAQDAGFGTKTNPKPGGRFQVLTRVAVEELEAWFLGDVQALVTAYPRVSPNLGAKARFRDADAVAGGTWEALERVLKRAGYYSGGLQKTRAAREIACHMDPQRNTSRSFLALLQGLRAMIGQP